jgi:hypothetical protein
MNDIKRAVAVATQPQQIHIWLPVALYMLTRRDGFCLPHLTKIEVTLEFFLVEQIMKLFGWDRKNEGGKTTSNMFILIACKIHFFGIQDSDVKIKISCGARAD